jgi:hypothetical protein
MSIEIYFNLHKKVFSIRHKGKVIDHATTVTVLNPKFVVQPAGRAKVLRDRVKNVHAFVRTDSQWTTEKLYWLVEQYLSKVDLKDDLPSCIPTTHVERVKYNPYMADTFVSCATGDAIHEADMAYLAIDNQNKPCISISRSSNEI